MQHLYDIYRASEEPMHVFTDAEVQSYEWSAQWTEFRARVGLPGVVLARAREIEDLWPSMPEP